MSKKPIISIIDPVHAAVDRIGKAIWAIVSVLVLGFMTMLLMVAGLVLDAWRYKSNSYDGMIEIIRGQEASLVEMKKERDEVLSILKDIRDQTKKPSQVIKK